MKTVWLKRGDRYESVRLMREYPEVGAVKVLRVGSPKPWTFRSSDIVEEKPLTYLQRKLIVKRNRLAARNAAQVDQVMEALKDGEPKSIMEIVNAVNAMPMANPNDRIRMEPARAWKIVHQLDADIVSDRSASGRHKRWIIKAKQQNPQ